jgi:dephospho-CoA kinase
MQQRIQTARKQSPQKVIVLEVPLLFEAGMEDWAHEILTITSTREKQLERLCRRSSLTQEQAAARIDSQLPLSEKVQRSHYVIENNGSEEQLVEALKRIWNRLSSTKQNPA